MEEVTEEDIRGLLESYMPFAKEVGVDSKELLQALLQVARAGVGHANRCLNCAHSRADRLKNEEAVKKRGIIMLQARACLLGLSSSSCGGVRKCIVPE